MNSSWQIGDKAACIKVGPWNGPEGITGVGPVAGTIYLVAAVWPRNADTGLAFADFPGAWYDSVEFVKVVPRSEQVAITEALTQETPIAAP